MAPNARGRLEEKERLRRSMREARAALPAEERARLAALAEEALLAVPELVAARTVLLFYAFGTEIPTRGLPASLRARGKRLLLPFLAEDGAMEAAEVHGEEELEPTSYGPREPESRVAVDPAQVDVVVAPGLAFDRDGNRLGYGGGHYDRYLRRMRPDATRVGLAYSMQLVDRVPADQGDERVDVLVTDRGAERVRPVQ